MDSAPTSEGKISRTKNEKGIACYEMPLGESKKCATYEYGGVDCGGTPKNKKEGESVQQWRLKAARRKEQRRCQTHSMFVSSCSTMS